MAARKASADNASGELMSRSAAGASVLMLGQVFTKMMTFSINQILIRFVSAHIFGITSFMEVIVSCILFYSREGIRLTCQRINDDDTKTRMNKANTMQLVINLSMVPILIGIPVGFVLVYTQIPDISMYKYHSLSAILLYVSSIVELASEFFYNLNQYNLNFKLRTKVESSALVIKCMVHFSIVIILHRSDFQNSGYYVLAYTVAQLAYSVSMFISYALYYRAHSTEGISLKLTKLQNGQYFDPKLVKYWLSLLVQLAFKYMLTEGDSFLLSYLCSTEEQGIFALISNYGSLIARMLFAPIEESLRLLLTKTFSKVSSRDKKLDMISVLSKIFKLYFYLLSLIVIFARFNSSFFLNMLIGDKWTSSNSLLSDAFKTYWLYIPFLAANGIIEGTFYSISSEPAQINRYSKIMVFCSIAYFVVLVALIRFMDMSLIGLIIANILNMSLRIAYCSLVLHRFLALDQLKVFDIIRDVNYVYASIASVCIYIIHTRYVGYEVYDFQHFFHSAVLGLLLLTIFIIIERSLILTLLRSAFSKKKLE